MEKPQRPSKRPPPRPAAPTRLVIAAVFGSCALGLISGTLHRRSAAWGAHEPIATDLAPKLEVAPNDPAAVDSRLSELTDED